MGSPPCIDYCASSGLLQEERVALSLGTGGGHERAVLGIAVLPTQNRWQKVKENVMKVVSVFAIRSEAMGKHLVQRVETKAAEAHVKTFRARNPFVKAQKQTPFFSLSPGRPRLSEAEIHWFRNRAQHVGLRWAFVSGIEEEQQRGSWMRLLAKKGAGWKGIRPNPEQSDAFLPPLVFILICIVLILEVPTEIASLLWANTDAKPLLQRLCGSEQVRWALHRLPFAEGARKREARGNSEEVGKRVCVAEITPEIRSRTEQASDHRVILALVWFLYHYIQSSGSSEKRVDVEASVLNLGIDVLHFFPCPSYPAFSCFLFLHTFQG